MTQPEKLLWSDLRKLELNIRRQAPIGRYIVDFVSHAARVVIEVDSACHDLPESEAHDAERTAWLKSQGYRVLRFRNGEVADQRVRVVNAIATAITGSPPELSDQMPVGSPPSPTLPRLRGKGELS
jgi:very-short-patch-repair endonuclease